MLSYPSDEVGNHLLDWTLLNKVNLNPYVDVISHREFEEKFGKSKHPFTGMDYVSYYKGIIEEEGAEAEIIFANNPEQNQAPAETVEENTQEATVEQAK